MNVTREMIAGGLFLLLWGIGVFGSACWETR